MAAVRGVRVIVASEQPRLCSSAGSVVDEDESTALPEGASGKCGSIWKKELVMQGPG